LEINQGYTMMHGQPIIKKFAHRECLCFLLFSDQTTITSLHIVNALGFVIETMFIVWKEVCECVSMSRVRDLTAPMHLGLYKPVLCAPRPIKGTPKHYWSFRWPPGLFIGSKKTKSGPDVHVWVRPKPHIYKKNIGRVFLHHPTFPVWKGRNNLFWHGYVLREGGTHCIANIVPCKM
jgi:hypothetical protein